MLYVDTINDYQHIEQILLYSILELHSYTKLVDIKTNDDFIFTFTFQVHLICMPKTEDNICERSSKFHFVNDFLYKEVGDHPENRSYVERYYPEGYEGGVANIPDHQDGGPPPQAAKQSQYNRHYNNERPAPPPSYYSRDNQNERQEDNRLQHLQQQKQRFELQQRQEQQRPQTRFRQRHQQDDFQSIDSRPIHQESIKEEVYQSQDLDKQQFSRKNVPSFENEKRKFQLSKPNFSEERPIFEHEGPPFGDEHQYSGPREESPIFERDHLVLDDLFRPIHGDENQQSHQSSDRRQPFDIHPRSPNREDQRQHIKNEEFDEGPSAHFSQHRAISVSEHMLQRQKHSL